MKATQKDFSAIAPRAARGCKVFLFCGPDEAAAADARRHRPSASHSAASGADLGVLRGRLLPHALGLALEPEGGGDGLGGLGLLRRFFCF